MDKPLVLGRAFQGLFKLGSEELYQNPCLATGALRQGRWGIRERQGRGQVTMRRTTASRAILGFAVKQKNMVKQ